MKMRKATGEKRQVIRAALSALHRPSGPPRDAASGGDGMKRRKLIRRVTVETERTYIFRSRGERQTAWCEGCGAEVEMACVGVAAREAGTSELAIYQLINSGALHFAEDAKGHALICLNSLRDSGAN